MEDPEEREDCARYLDDLGKRGIVVSLDAGGLRCTANRGSIPPEIVQDLKKRRSALISYLETRPRVAATELVRQPRDGTVPLSKGQAVKLAWARRALANGLPALYAVGLVELDGPIDAGRLLGAVGTLYARHLVFGARLSSSGDGWHYRLGAAAADPDSSGPESSTLAADAVVPVAPGALGAGLRDFLAAPLPPDGAPLARMKVFVSGNSRAVAAFWLNPLFADAWSIWVLKTDFLRACRAPAGEAGPPPLQFSDYILWKNGNDRFIAERQIPFWRDVLRGWPPYRAGSRRVEGRTAFFTLGPDLCRDLREMCRRHRTTPFSALFALFQVLVGTLYDRRDVVAGVVGGRAMPALADAVAFCANYVPIRTVLDPDMSYLDLFLSVQKSCAAANEHSYPHAEDLCEVLAVGPALGSAQFHYNPLPVTGQFGARDCYEEWRRLSGCLGAFAVDEDVRMTVLDDGGDRIYGVMSTREAAGESGAGALATRYGQIVERATKDSFARWAS